MRALTCFLIALAWACAPPADSGAATDDVRLDVEPGSPSPGDSVTLILTNGAGGQVGYNLCPSQLQRRTGTGWQPVPSERICTMELRMLPAGEEARYTLLLPVDIEPGEYRYTASLEGPSEGERSEARSDSFEVAGG